MDSYIPEATPENAIHEVARTDAGILAEAKRAVMEAFLTVADILGAADLQEGTVDVPEWGGKVRIRQMTKATQANLRKQATVAGEVDSDRLEVLMFINCVVEPQFDAEEHYEALRGKSGAAIDRVNKAILGLNGMSKEAVTEADRSFPN